MKPRPRILVVDDESAMREVLQARLAEWGYDVRSAASVRAARGLIATFDPHAVISDLVMPEAGGMELLAELRADRADRAVFLITSYGTIGTAVQAIKAGAADFLTKPLDYVSLRRQLDAATASVIAQRTERPATDPAAVADAASDEPAPGGLIGRSAAMTRMWAALDAAAASDTPVLIVGESGSGKERVARTIHERSARAARRFVPVNAAAIPEALAEGEIFGFERGSFTGATETRAGLIEEAHRGTLFLDEITEMPAQLQPKLLRVLEDGKVRRVGGRVEMAFDARIIAATNRAPREAVEQGRLRHDLLYRLDVLRVEVPPLRARLDDLPALAAHFLAAASARHGEANPGFAPAALEAMTSHAWPGNVRELRNIVERAYAATRVTRAGAPIEADQLGLGAEAGPDAAHAGIVIPHGITAAAAERILILETLKATSNNKAEAARRLGLDVKTIRNKLKTFGVAEGDE